MLRLNAAIGVVDLGVFPTAGILQEFELILIQVIARAQGHD
jgi:hypothetical protein